MASIPPRERRLRRKICSEINGCYWEAFNRRSDSIIHAVLLSIFCSTPLINNLDSCHWFSRMYGFTIKSVVGRFMSFSQCQNLLGSERSFTIQFINHGGLMLLTEAEELLRVNHPIILLRVAPHSHTCMSLTFPFWFLAVFLFLSRPPGVLRPAGVQRRRGLLPRHVHVQQQHRGLQRERTYRHSSQPAREHGWDVSTVFLQWYQQSQGRML